MLEWDQFKEKIAELENKERNLEQDEYDYEAWL